MDDRTPPAATPPADWHALPADAVCARLQTGPDGLSDAEAARRLAQHGANALPEPPRPSAVRRFLEQFNNALIYFLLAAAVAATLLSHVIDAAVIVAVVVVNAIVGFVQEGRAEQALAAIRGMIAPHATVIRGGVRQSLDARALVPGDLVLVEAGDKVPADLRLLRARGALADEAILTGESVPAEKHEAPAAAGAPLAERGDMLYCGTLLAAGQASGIVVATGATTEIGRVSTLVGQVRTLTTPLLEQVNLFGRRFTLFAFAMAVLLFAFVLAVRGDPWVDALIIVVALAVSIVPEGLPAVITITLAIGVRRMARRQAIVRRLPAVETLGATSVICSDKTGTLTRNEMTARHVIADAGEVQASGSGYAPEGALSPDASAAALAAALAIARAGLLCSDAQLVERDGRWRVLGDPMEGALVALAAKAGMDVASERAAWPRLDEIPFDAQHRFMATLHRAPGGSHWIFVKGAPEAVMGMCPALAEDDAARRWNERIAAAAARGERVLGFAAMRAAPEVEQLSLVGLPRTLDFLGAVGFIDPPRDEAMAAIAECRDAGIAVKMITGDHVDTAVAIARQLGMAEAPHALTGAQLDALDDATLARAIADTQVFARTSPEHKLRIVRALQAGGLVVAMTGDGVNDAPALRQADVGIAMGRKGTEAAKEASEMVLADDNFASIVAAVHEGRTVYDNVRKVIGWTLPTNGGEVLCVVVALLAGLTLPMTPVQILWINLILTVTLGLSLAFEPTEPGVMQRPPRPRDAPLLSRGLVWRTVLVSVLIMLGVFAAAAFARAMGLADDGARTVVVNAIVAMEIGYLFNVRYLHASSLHWRGLLGTPAVLGAIATVLAAQALYTYAPFMQRLFGSVPLAPMHYVPVVASGVAVMAIMELDKHWRRGRTARPVPRSA